MNRLYTLLVLYSCSVGPRQQWDVMPTSAYTRPGEVLFKWFQTFPMLARNVHSHVEWKQLLEAASGEAASGQSKGGPLLCDRGLDYMSGN